MAAKTLELVCLASVWWAVAARLGGRILAQSPWLTTEIKADYVVVNDLRYSRKGAEGGNLGTACKLMHPLGIPPIVQFQQTPPTAWTNNNVAMDFIANITSEQAAEWDLSGKVSFKGATGEGHIGGNGSHSASMIIQKFSFSSTWKILNWMNGESNTDWVKMFRAMDMPRIVTDSWILVDQSVPEIGHSCIHVNMSVEFAGQGGSFSGSGCGDSVWSFSPGSVMAYRLSKVVFDDEGTAIRLEPDVNTR